MHHHLKINTLNKTIQCVMFCKPPVISEEIKMFIKLMFDLRGVHITAQMILLIRRQGGIARDVETIVLKILIILIRH